jgi:hypothetical protein
MESLRSVARWCLHQYRGILTPTGRQKKPPTFQIVMCEKGHIGLTSSKVAKAQRYKCTEYVMKRKAVPAFNTYDVKPMKCDLDTEVIETIKEEL